MIRSRSVLARRCAVGWLLTIPVSIVGVLLAHAATYRLAIPDSDERAHVLEHSGHAYLDYLPAVVALCFAVSVVALALRIRVALSPSPPSGAPPWSFAAVGPLGFAFLEHVERFARTGSIDPSTAVEPLFLLGLALQLPFALCALVIARVLVSLADAVGRALPGGAPGLSLTPAVPVPRAAEQPRVRVTALAYGERGPPPLTALP